MYLPSVERLCVEGHCGRVAALDTVDGDFAPQLHPGHSEDGAGVGTGQCEDVLLVVLEEIKDSYGEKETEPLKSVRQDMMRAATRNNFFWSSLWEWIVWVIQEREHHFPRSLNQVRNASTADLPAHHPCLKTQSAVKVIKCVGFICGY